MPGYAPGWLSYTSDDAGPGQAPHRRSKVITLAARPSELSCGEVNPHDEGCRRDQPHERPDLPGQATDSRRARPKRALGGVPLSERFAWREVYTWTPGGYVGESTRRDRLRGSALAGRSSGYLSARASGQELLERCADDRRRAGAAVRPGVPAVTGGQHEASCSDTHAAIGGDRGVRRLAVRRGEVDRCEQRTCASAHFIGCRHLRVNAPDERRSADAQTCEAGQTCCGPPDACRAHSRAADRARPDRCVRPDTRVAAGDVNRRPVLGPTKAAACAWRRRGLGLTSRDCLRSMGHCVLATVVADIRLRPTKGTAAASTQYRIVTFNQHGDGIGARTQARGAREREGYDRAQGQRLPAEPEMRTKASAR